MKVELLPRLITLTAFFRRNQYFTGLQYTVPAWCYFLKLWSRVLPRILQGRGQVVSLRSEIKSALIQYKNAVSSIGSFSVQAACKGVRLFSSVTSWRKYCSQGTLGNSFTISSSNVTLALCFLVLFLLPLLHYFSATQKGAMDLLQKWGLSVGICSNLCLWNVFSTFL